MTWYFFLAASILLSSVNGLLHRLVMKKDQSDPRAQTVIFGILVGALSFSIALFRGLHFPQFPLLIPNFFLMILVLTLAPLFTFRAYQLNQASEVGILLLSQRLWVVIGAVFFLGESATLAKTLGTLLILGGVGLVLWRSHQIKITKGTLSALMAAFFYGVSYVNAFYILQHLDAVSFEVYASLLPAVTLLIIQPQTLRKMHFYLLPSNSMKVGLAAIFDTLATLSLYLAYQLGRNASQIAPLSATSTLFTVALAAIFLKERENLINKLLGAAIVTLGTVLIIHR
jgi:drug/metabolite transporter (DMT)-like permease